MKIQIADLKLPEQSISNIRSILESNNMPVIVPEDERGKFNCWGFTAYYHGWVNSVFWLDREPMADFLKNRTKPIDKEKVKAGDIAVFDRGGYLTHTAIMLPDGNLVCHKPGGRALCIDTVDNVKKSYGAVRYARVKRKVEKEFDTPTTCATLTV
jgi:cell wall-associated NlpC family hydrolase